MQKGIATSHQGSKFGREFQLFPNVSMIRDAIVHCASEPVSFGMEIHLLVLDKKKGMNESAQGDVGQGKDHSQNVEKRKQHISSIFIDLVSWLDSFCTFSARHAVVTMGWNCSQ